MFVYQPVFNTLRLKQDKGTEYITAWKSKGLFKSRLHPWHNTFLSNIKRLGHKIGIQFNNTALIVEQTFRPNKVVDQYEFNYSLRNMFNNFTLKNCLFSTTNIVKYDDESKYLYSSYGVTFDGIGSWSIGN